MAYEPPVWLPFVQPFGTVFLGIGAFWLARRQWVTANEKLKLDLYERRDKVLDRVVRDLNEVIGQGDLHRIGLGQTRYSLMQMKTFFGGRTELYIDELMTDLTPTVISYRRPTPEERRDPARKQEHDEFERFWDLALRLGPLLQESALADMKIRVSSKPFWLISKLAPEK